MKSSSTPISAEKLLMFGFSRISQMLNAQLSLVKGRVLSLMNHPSPQGGEALPSPVKWFEMN